MNFPEPDPIEFEINGELDLHAFRPSEIGELIPDYIELCLEKRIHRIGQERKAFVHYILAGKVDYKITDTLRKKAETISEFNRI